jgi:hypothetical protein
VAVGAAIGAADVVAADRRLAAGGGPALKQEPGDLLEGDHCEVVALSFWFVRFVSDKGAKGY